MFRVQDLWFGGLGFRIWDLGFRWRFEVQDLELGGLMALGFGVQGVWVDLGFRA